MPEFLILVALFVIEDVYATFEPRVDPDAAFGEPRNRETLKREAWDDMRAAISDGIVVVAESWIEAAADNWPEDY